MVKQGMILVALFVWIGAVGLPALADPIQAEETQRPAVGGDLPRAIANVARGNYKAAVPVLTRFASQGNPQAQFYLGSMYELGQGVHQDYAEAVRLYKLAASQGHSEAEDNLGQMYKYGRGVARSDVEALRLYTLAADRGSLYGQNNLGAMYAEGRGTVRDDA